MIRLPRFFHSIITADSMSVCTGNEQPGYAEIQAARALHPNSGAWAFFMREIIGLPCELTPAVSRAILLETWKSAADPLEAVRSGALKEHSRAWGRLANGFSTITTLRNRSQQ
jgi:hypothetical protein